MKRLITTYILTLLFATNITAQEYLNVNGKLIPVARIKSIKTSVKEHSRTLSAMLKQDPNISIYVEALNATGIMDSLDCYSDPTYGFISEQAIKDSCTWTNNDLCIFTGGEYDNVAYPEQRYLQHTMFAVTDDVLKTKYGITSLSGLRAKAKEIYDDVDPEDAGVSNEKSRRNSLNKFISYHILNFFGSYYNLTANDGNALAEKFDREHYDIQDWYETLMPHSMMKLSFPSSSDEGLYINRRGVQNRPDERGTFVRGSMVMPSDRGPEEATGINGIYHYIDDIIAYSRETQEVVFDDRIRLDCTTLSPDFMTIGSDGQMPRGHSTEISEDDGMYGNNERGNVAVENPNHCIGFKSGYVRNFSFNNDTHLHIRNRTLHYWSYEGDEVTIKGNFDVKVKLPPVPAGTYEVRLMTCIGLLSRGTLASYIDGVPQAMPIDMRVSSLFQFGYRSDDKLGDDESIYTFDRYIHNKGWMKGPTCYPAGTSSFRELSNTVRCVLGRFKTDGKTDHYLRLKQLSESGGELDFDFIELVPSSVYDNEYYFEDKY